MHGWLVEVSEPFFRRTTLPQLSIFYVVVPLSSQLHKRPPSTRYIALHTTKARVTLRTFTAENSNSGNSNIVTFEVCSNNSSNIKVTAKTTLQQHVHVLSISLPASLFPPQQQQQSHATLPFLSLPGSCGLFIRPPPFAERGKKKASLFREKL